MLLTSTPTWYGDLKAKAEEPVDIQALCLENFYKKFYSDVERDLSQASSLCPLPTPGSKPSDS